MPNLLETLTNDAATVSTEAEKRRRRVEDYLDHLCAPLLGTVPYPARLAFRIEAEEHLYSLIEDREHAGLPPQAATEAALREYGSPWRTGESFRDGWIGARATGATARGNSAEIYTFAGFGLASVVNTLFVQNASLSLSQYGDRTEQAFLLACVSPLIAGVALGARLNRTSARTVIAVMGCVLLQTAAATALMASTSSPTRRMAGIHDLLFQSIIWPPIYLLTAYVSATVQRHRRRVGFLRRVPT